MLFNIVFIRLIVDIVSLSIRSCLLSVRLLKTLLFYRLIFRATWLFIWGMHHSYFFYGYKFLVFVDYSQIATTICSLCFTSSQTLFCSLDVNCTGKYKTSWSYRIQLNSIYFLKQVTHALHAVEKEARARVQKFDLSNFPGG